MTAANTGITKGVPWAEYLEIPGISITRLKEIDRSPMHYLHRLKHPKQSKPLTFGRAAHVAVLEPDRFSRDHAVWRRRTDSGRLAPRNGQHYDKFVAEVGHREIITEDEHDAALALQEAVRGNRDAAPFLEAGDPEVVLRWQIAGLDCRGRVDWMTRVDGRPCLVGLKSTRDCRPRIFGRQAGQLGYHLQWAFYRDGFRAITGEDPRMIEIVVESEAPHASVVYEVPDDAMQRGFDEYMRLLERLQECARNNHWPGPAPGIQAVDLPSWVYGEEEIVYVEE